MKTFKIFIIALIGFFAFDGANAQVMVRKGPQHQHKMMVMKRRQVHHRHSKHPVVMVKHRRY